MDQTELRMNVVTLSTKTLKFLALIGLLAILGSIGAAVFFFAGFVTAQVDASRSG